MLKIGKWLAAPMKKSIGIESQVLVARGEEGAARPLGLIGRAPAPVSAVALTAAMIFFCSGQMIIQTFRNMIVPRPPPTMIEMVRLLAPQPARHQAVAQPMKITTMAIDHGRATRPSFSGPPATEARKSAATIDERDGPADQEDQPSRPVCPRLLGVRRSGSSRGNP